MHKSRSIAVLPVASPTLKPRQPSIWRRPGGMMMLAGLLAMAMAVVGCATPPPTRQADACAIFAQAPHWLKPTRRAAAKWRADGAVMLAIMKQESAFDANAKPRRRRFLGIPWRRPSSAFGYSQALDSTWRLYKKKAKRRFARRDNFADAMDFIGWYLAQNRRQLKIDRRDGYRHYLAYHEGWGGYKRRTYQQKKWLLTVAARVSTQAKRYRAQLNRCGMKMP